MRIRCTTLPVSTSVLSLGEGGSCSPGHLGPFQKEVVRGREAPRPRVVRVAARGTQNARMPHCFEVQVAVRDRLRPAAGARGSGSPACCQRQKPPPRTNRARDAAHRRQGLNEVVEVAPDEVRGHRPPCADHPCPLPLPPRAALPSDALLTLRRPRLAGK